MFYLLIYSEKQETFDFYDQLIEDKFIQTFKLFDFKKGTFCCGDSNLKLKQKYIYPTIGSFQKKIPFTYNSNKDLIPISSKQFKFFKTLSFKDLSKLSKNDFLENNGLEEWII